MYGFQILRKHCNFALINKLVLLTLVSFTALCSQRRLWSKLTVFLGVIYSKGFFNDHDKHHFHYKRILAVLSVSQISE